MTLPERDNQTYIRTASGRQCWPLNPQPQDICIEDIASALSKVCRFGGHTKEFYSVAQHSVIVSHMVPREHALAGLLHDASEAYIADIVLPIKGHQAGYYQIEERLMQVIAQVFGFPYPLPEDVKIADQRILTAERRDVMPDADCPHTPGDVPIFTEIICPLKPEVARMDFLYRYLVLTQ